MWRGSMNRSVIRNLVVVALIAYPAFAFGQDQAPDVKGKWIGKTHTILVGKGGHWPKGRGTWANPALLEKDLAFDIRGHDGRRFWGVTTISGGGEKTDEPFIGELTGKDYKSFVFADTDGFWNGQLDGGDVLSFCYMHNMRSRLKFTRGSPTTYRACVSPLNVSKASVMSCACRMSGAVTSIPSVPPSFSIARLSSKASA